ncbi:hypothetical protein C900_00819 [Fulvivirga imtechensis AK7]|uniref:GyrI-like small molecule binding domain-containing protein n=1 Tax=Fulvivirga imtechensis AK7 TaxID=1237149 RepID=L8JXE9_9BACT|nr:GyrI-like domain-containing protein [Fulvivirga imtechensis]ELR72858.1 hypothetical protein C900_00819 [Fulvivirga imtechensis AK7]
MDKLDLTKRYKSYYTAKAKPEITEIEPAKFLSIQGVGDPSGSDFADNVQALYATAYAIKFVCKALNKDFVVSKLEGLWWFDEQKYKGYTMEEAPVKIPRSEWGYRLLIRMPEYVTEQIVQEAIASTVEKKELPLAREIELYPMTEGKVVQMLHVGPFNKETETLLQMNEFIQENNFDRNGLHHEIYLSDFRKTAPEKLKTILREPVK